MFCDIFDCIFNINMLDFISWDKFVDFMQIISGLCGIFALIFAGKNFKWVRDERENQEMFWKILETYKLLYFFIKIKKENFYGKLTQLFYPNSLTQLYEAKYFTSNKNILKRPFDDFLINETMNIFIYDKYEENQSINFYRAYVLNIKNIEKFYKQMKETAEKIEKMRTNQKNAKTTTFEDLKQQKEQEKSFNNDKQELSYIVYNDRNFLKNERFQELRKKYEKMDFDKFKQEFYKELPIDKVKKIKDLINKCFGFNKCLDWINIKELLKKEYNKKEENKENETIYSFLKKIEDEYLHNNIKLNKIIERWKKDKKYFDELYDELFIMKNDPL